MQTAQLHTRFLSGSGEMSTLIRTRDWNGTPVGEINQWPQSLRTTLSNLLASKFPMFLWWGPELICFYNDAYRPSLGTNGKHPHILGEPAREAWPEIWPIIHPLIDQVLKGGESTWSEDELIPIYRNGKIEDVYWTFSYSPVLDENETIAGVLVTCFETTEKVLSRNQFHRSVMQAPVAICIFRGPGYIVEMVNEKMLELWDKKREEVLNRGVFEGVYEAANQGFEQILHSVYTKGERFSANDIPVWLSRSGVATQVYVNLLYEPLREDDGTITGIVAVATEVTDAVLAKKKLQDTEERARLAIEAGQLGTFDLNIVTGNIIGSNRFHELFGIDVSDRHHDYFSTIYPEDFPVQQAAFATALQTGKLSYETRILWPDGTIHWVQVDGQILFGENGDPVRQLGTIKDISESKKAAETLRLTNERFRLLTNSMPQIIWTANAAGVFNYYNQALLDYTGLTPEQVDAEGWLGVVHHEDHEDSEKKWKRAVATGQDFLIEHRFLRQDRQYRWQLSRAVPQKDSHGQIQMWIGTSTDIHELKMHEQQKNDFIKMASHELKTPLTTIKGYAQLLLQNHSNTDDSFLFTSLSTIDRQVSKLTKLIVQLLDVTKIETGNVHLAKEVLPIGEIVRDTVADLQAATQTHAIQLSAHANPLVCVDKDRIQQVLTNLITNAIKYSPNADTVMIDIDSSDDQAIVSIRDFGIGITHEDQPKIFERFYRVSGKDEKTFPGFGIGLFIVNEILSLHDGKIRVKSEKDQGSEFSFSLPVFVSRTIPPVAGS